MTLPTWDEMSDLDKGAALLHVHKRDYEGDEYAVSDYPVAYFDHPDLLALEMDAACDHAAKVGTGPAESLEPDEYVRLYDGALDAKTARHRKRFEIEGYAGQRLPSTD